MKFRQALFWDTDPATIDPTKHAKYIIERIMDFGDDSEVRWMWKQYPKKLLADVARSSKVLRKSSRTFWRLLSHSTTADYLSML